MWSEILLSENSLSILRKEWLYFAALNPYPVLRFDAQGRIVANPRAINALGIRPGSQPSLGDLIPGIRKIDFNLCISRGSSISTHGKIGVRHYHFTFRGVPSQGFGHLYCTDITLLRLARKRLIESKRFLRKVVDSIQTTSSLKILKAGSAGQTKGLPNY